MGCLAPPFDQGRGETRPSRETGPRISEKRLYGTAQRHKTKHPYICLRERVKRRQLIPPQIRSGAFVGAREITREIFAAATRVEPRSERSLVRACPL